MSKKLPASKPAKSIQIDWGQEVSFDVPVVARAHTQTSLQVMPITVEYAELPPEPTDCRTQTGNTEFLRREPPSEIPPAKAA